MDYDDDDFQSQNLHLAGEGSTNFPPVLRPYALPKFDFDESLQGHIRYDSLVETEVFLGIESNEDNQWIDAYSRGNSGIEFSSTAAESCSIPRHNNVWSEATSTESVEMLLKSVGQEEFIPGQTAIQESDAFDELACLAKQMEPNPKPDDKNDFRDNAKDLQPPGCTHENLPGSKPDVEMEQSLAGVPQIHEGESSIGGSSSTLQPYDICRNMELPVSGGMVFTDGRSNDTNQSKFETLADSSLCEKTQVDSSASGVKTNITTTSTENISSTGYVLNIQNTQNQVVDRGAREQISTQIQTKNQDLESSVLNKDCDVDIQISDGNAVGCDANHSYKPICSIPMEGLESGSVLRGLETGVSSSKDSLCIVPNGISDLQKAERRSEDVCFRDTSLVNANENATLITDAEVDDPSAPNRCDLKKVAIRDDSNSEGQVDTLEKNYSESSIFKANELLSIGKNMDTEILLSKSEECMIAVGDNSISSLSEGTNDTKVGGFSSFGRSTTAAFAEPSISGEATHLCESNELDRQGDSEKFSQDVSVNDQESKKVPFDSSQVHSDVDQSHLVDQGFGSSSHNADRVETVLAGNTVSTDNVSVNNSASQSVNISLTSCEIVDIPLNPSRVEFTHEVTDHIKIQRVTVVDSASVDENEDCGARIDKEAAISTFGSSEEVVAPSVTGMEKQILSETPKQLLCKTVSNSPQNLETAAAAEKCGEPQAQLSVTDNQECTKEVGMSLVLCESTKKQGDVDVVTISIANDDKKAIQENHDKSLSKISGDIVCAIKGSVTSGSLPDSHTELHETGHCLAHATDNACGLSTTFGSPPETLKDQNRIKVSANLNPPVSEFINKDETNTESAVHDLKGIDASKDERCLTPELMTNFPKEDNSDLTKRGKEGAKRQPVSVTAAKKASRAVEVSASASGSHTGKTKIARNISHGSQQISDGEVAYSVSKGTPERKTRRGSKTAGKESSRKGSRVKEKTPVRQSGKGDRSTSIPVSLPPGFQLLQSNELQPYGHIEAIGAKPLALLNASTSNLPDLNTSTSLPVLFQQPFSDIQQVQLRAQIFVYGALIQGATPDEAHMISAFDGPDGGRNIWEKAWHSCMERQHGKKSHPVSLESPPQSQSGPRASDSAVKQSAVQGKGISSPVGRASSKGIPTVANPLIPLSSPLWSLPTPTSDSLHSGALARGSIGDYPQALTSLPPYQATPLRNFVGHNTCWMSQAPLRGPWIASPAPTPDNNSNLSASPSTDTIKFSSVKGSSVPPSSGIKNALPSVPASSVGLQSVPVGTAPLDTRNVTVSHAQPSDPKPKKRKKGMVSEDLGKKPLEFQSQLELTSGVGKHISTAAAIATPVGSVPITTVENSVVSMFPPTLAGNLKVDLNVDKRVLSDESLAKVKEARVNAEEASILSAAAVNHSVEIWKQLDKQKNSGLVSDIEAKLASAAVAIAAAAAAAKAAAAAADVASNAALQAKLMADEALAVSSFENSCQIANSEVLNDLGKATPASILKGANGTNSSASIIIAAKEASRRKVEAASAARKRAENMDAIVKAAELAAEAVSQAGKIVTMGDPLPLSDLVQAGPEGCWKASRDTQQVVLLHNMNSGLVNADNVEERPATSHMHKRDISSNEMGDPVAASEKFVDDISTSLNTNKSSSKGPKARKVSNIGNLMDVLPESENEIPASSTVGNGSENLEENNIKEGSLVEVFKDGVGFKAAWFTANILSLKDGKAYVCYNVLVGDEGAGHLKEWVSLHGEGDKPPRIRTARPLTGLHNEGTRKRRRSTMVGHIWSIGDRVEAWIQESWHEGVVTDKNKKDETLTVHFPATGETSVVRAWHLRSCLIWKDGKWIESSKAGANDDGSTHEGKWIESSKAGANDDGSTHESDAPHEKRPKLGSPAGEVRGKDRMSKGAVDSVNPGELRLLDLTENDKVFDIGKNSKTEKKPDTHIMVRTGLQKEGSRVIFGVPKPGKKRKFMEVSKHYVAGGTNKINDGNNSVKLGNLMPQGSGSRSWRNFSKNDTKEKLGADPMPKTFKPIKPHTVSASHTNDLTSHIERIKDPSSLLKNASQSENQIESASNSGTTGVGGGRILYSSLASSIDYHPTKKTSASRASKGKLAPAGGKSGKVEVEKASTGNLVKSASEVIEPRRSNRRIQPTSRLLEGLQSSLIISKIPSSSHEKAHKNQNRTTSRGNKQG